MTNFINKLTEMKFSKTYKKLAKLQAEYDLLLKELKPEMIDYMKANNLTSIVCEDITISYRKPHVKTTVDSKKLQEELPDVYRLFSKESNVSETVVLKVNY